jgi:hypothetical protein
MNLDTLIREINMLTKIFECGDESGALKNIRAMNSNPTLLRDVKLDNPQKNAELVKALAGLSKFKDKINTEIPHFYERIYNIGENARKTLNA